MDVNLLSFWYCRKKLNSWDNHVGAQILNLNIHKISIMKLMREIYLPFKQTEWWIELKYSHQIVLKEYNTTSHQLNVFD